MIQKHLHYCCLLLCLLAACKKQDAPTYEQVDKYGNGQVSRRYPVVNGKKEGKMSDYYNTGALMAERWFENDLQHGRTTIFYPSGALKEVQYFDKGLRQAGDTIWYEDGKIQFVTNMKDNKKDGYLRKWDPAGNLVFEAKYQMDSLVEVKGKVLQPASAVTGLKR